MKITIKEIAEKAGVSNAAVSLAINNKQGVGEDTRERILRVARELGYETINRGDQEEEDIVLRFLKISRHGHTVNPSHNNFIDAYVEGITTASAEHSAVMEMENYAADVPLETITNKIYDSPQISGYLILGTELSEEDIQEFLKTGKNIVFLDTYIDYIEADFVDMNNTDAVHKVIRHFTDCGHSSIGLIKSSVNTRNFYLREKAYYQAMEKAGLIVSEDFIFDVDSTFDNAHDDFKSLIDSGKELPTAFFAINDIIAMGCMKALKEKGLSVPDQVSIAGFDNLPMAGMVTPSLTSIDVSKKEIGRTAVEMLVMKTRRKEALPPRKTQIGGRLIKRESVKRLI